MTAGGTWGIGGPTALSTYAPTVQAGLVAVAAAWPSTVSALRVAMIRTVAAEAHGLRPLPRPPDRPRAELDQPQQEVLTFAEVFAADVTLIDDDLRESFRAALGPAALPAAEAIYVADAVPRARSVLDGLFGPEEWLDAPLTSTGHLSALIDELIREVTLLDALDPVTSDLVRLRAARQHGCRICMSRRNLDAIEAGATATTYQELDHYRTSRLDPARQAALALTDAYILTPGRLRPTLVEDVRRHLTPAQAVEVVLDTMRNCVAKVLVSLGTDAPRVPSGVELFRFTELGDLEFP